jgi:capsular polysaccharide biosynthesis protein
MLMVLQMKRSLLKMEDKHYDDEISLKELILALVNNWKLIAIFVVVAAVLALGYVFIIADEVYESSIDGMISVPEITATRYGDYTFPSANKMDYLNVILSESVIQKTIQELGLDSSVNGFRNSITITSDEKLNRFSFSLSGPTPEETQNRISVLTKHYMDEIVTMYKESALGYFVREKHVQSKQLDETLLNQEAKLKALEEEFKNVSPVITLQKMIISNPVYAAELSRSRGIRIEDLTDEMMLEEVVNENYLIFQGTIIELRKSIQDTKLEIEKNARHSIELRSEQNAVQNYILNGDDSKLTPDMLNVMESKIQLAAHPSYPESPIAPKKELTLAIALVLGGMLGVFVAFFKEYWKNN